MRIFEHPNSSTPWKCPICGEDDDRPIALIPVAGTQKGNIAEAAQFHLECIDLTWYSGQGVVQSFPARYLK